MAKRWQHLIKLLDPVRHLKGNGIGRRRKLQPQNQEEEGACAEGSLGVEGPWPPPPRGRGLQEEESEREWVSGTSHSGLQMGHYIKIQLSPQYDVEHPGVPLPTQDCRPHQTRFLFHSLYAVLVSSTLRELHPHLRRRILSSSQFRFPSRKFPGPENTALSLGNSGLDASGASAAITPHTLAPLFPNLKNLRSSQKFQNPAPQSFL